MSLVLVTGGSGFIGSHAILQLLDAGHTVRTTVRSLKREEAVRSMLKAAGCEAGDPTASVPFGHRLTFAVADLMADGGWPEAMAGCDYVLHVASPFPANAPQHEDELIVPAREGTLRALRAARDAGVKRVVLTSSFAAVGYGHASRAAPFDETTWTDLSGTHTPVSAYVKSKTLAERAAWEFMEREGGELELAVINPVGVFGPTLGPDLSTSVVIVQMLLNGALPGVPQVATGLVDVRDVVDLHLRAMTAPEARGERFLAVAGDFIPIVELARILKARMGQAGRRVPTRELPNWLVRFAALFDATLRQVVPELGHHKGASNEKARRVLGWQPRSNEESLVASAGSLLELGLLKP